MCLQTDADSSFLRWLTAMWPGIPGSHLIAHRSRLLTPTSCKWLEFSLRIFAALVLCGTASAAQPVIPVWPNKAPGSESWTHQEIEFRERPLPSAPPMIMIRDVVMPTLTLFQPTSEKRTGTAIIVCPGGGFRILDWNNEGTRVAKWLAARGITAFVLKYRLVPTPKDPVEFQKAMASLSPVDSTNPPKGLKDLFGDKDSLTGFAMAVADGKQSVKVVRQRAKEWGIALDRIGMMGFSAGGFVTMGVVMEHDTESRLNFVAAIYGGETGGHAISADAPPLFAAVAQNDELGMAGIVEKLYADWNGAKLPAELHVFSKGGHGFGTIEQGLPVDHWLELFADWLQSQLPDLSNERR